MPRSVPSAPRAPKSRPPRSTRASGTRARATGLDIAPELQVWLSPLEGHPWVRRLAVLRDRPTLFRVAAEGERFVEIPLGERSVYVHVVWDAGDRLRADFVDNLLELTRVRAREAAVQKAAERAAADLARARRARIELEMELGAAEAVAHDADARAVAAAAKADETQRMLVEHERFTAMSAMCASVAHDIRSPLTALVWNLRVLEEQTHKDGVSVDPTVDELFQDTKLACDLIEGVLEGLRTFATGSGAPRQFDAHQVLIATVRLFRWHVSQRGVRFVQRVDENLPAWGTPSEVCQIILNLLANAADASPRGGVVRLEAFKQGDDVVVRVTDEGPGIAATELEAVFEPFHSTKEGGLGIGLTVARAMARRHGGDLVVAPRAKGEPGACLELRLRDHATA